MFKPVLGNCGDGIEKTNDPAVAQQIIQKNKAKGNRFLMQELIETGGSDYRAFIVGDKVIGIIKLTPQKGEWRSNNTLGADITAAQLTEEQQQLSLQAMKLAKLGYGAVDLLITPEGKTYVCEINDYAGTQEIEDTHPSLTIIDEVVKLMEQDVLAGKGPEAPLVPL